MPLPGGTTLTFLNAVLHQLIKWKRSSLRRSSIARFFSKASELAEQSLYYPRVYEDASVKVVICARIS